MILSTIWRLYARKKPSKTAKVAQNILNDLSIAYWRPRNYNCDIFFGEMNSIFRFILVFMVATKSTFYNAFNFFDAIYSGYDLCYKVLHWNFWVILDCGLSALFRIDFFSISLAFVFFTIRVLVSNCNEISGFYVTFDCTPLGSIWNLYLLKVSYFKYIHKILWSTWH